MAKTYLTKKWNDLTEGEKRSALWGLMDNKVLKFKENVDYSTVVEIIKKNKDIDFCDKADSIREEIYELCLSFTKDPRKILIAKRILRMED